MKARVLAAMSGGVDSSVAAFLLKEAGYDVTGVTMCMGIPPGDGKEGRTCCSPEAIRSADRLCTAIGIPHYVMDVSRELKSMVIDTYVEEYLRGRTPNPCIACNRHLKFGLLLEKARASGFDYLATGHYAMVDNDGHGPCLRRPKDRAKDQTYFLACITRDALGSVLFPLAHLTKEEVRSLAKGIDAPVARRRESQDLCFALHKDSSVLFSSLAKGTNPGLIVDLHGTVLGEHTGTVFYTIGQRRGLGIAARSRLYVVAIDAQQRRVVVGPKEALRAEGLVASQINLLASNLPDRAHAKIRYRSRPAPCRIERMGDPDCITVMFEEPQDAVTPGQSIVFYDGDLVLGSAVIDERIGSPTTTPPSQRGAET